MVEIVVSLYWDGIVGFVHSRHHWHTKENLKLERRGSTNAGENNQNISPKHLSDSNKIIIYFTTRLQL